MDWDVFKTESRFGQELMLADNYNDFFDDWQGGYNLAPWRNLDVYDKLMIFELVRRQLEKYFVRAGLSGEDYHSLMVFIARDLGL